MKAYKKTMIITVLITLFPILIGLALWNKLPDQLPTHWDAGSQVDGWTDKAKAIFFLPCLMAVIQVVVAFRMFADPKAKNIHKKLLIVSLWIVPILSICLNAASYMTALGVQISMTVLCCLLIGILFLALGNYLPKLQQNYTVGIKIAWALADEDNWERTHRFGGKLMVVSGLLMVLLAFISSWLGDTATFILLIILTLISSIVPMIYSYVIYRRKNK